MNWIITTAIVIVCLVIATASAAICWEIMQDEY